MDQIECMRTFLKVAELSSFTQAARALGLPKANVSSAVAQLEAHLGVRLLHRTTRRVQLSQDGRVFAERARDVVSDLDDLTTHFQADSRGLSGKIRVDMPTGIARDLIVPGLPDFLERHPGIEVELSSTERVVDLLHEGFDCTVRAGTLGDSSLFARPLGHYHIVNCASPSYLARYGVPQGPDDLAHHRLVHYASVLGSPPDGFEYLDAGDGRQQTRPMIGAVTVNNANAYLAACRAGLGIIQIPRIGVQRELKEGVLVEILPQFTAAPMPVSLVYVHRRYQPRRVRAFMDWATEVLRPVLSGATVSPPLTTSSQ